MKKIVSNVLIVSTQLIVGGLFLFMLFSNKTEDNRVVVVENNNLDKMADAVSELFPVFFWIIHKCTQHSPLSYFLPEERHQSQNNERPGILYFHSGFFLHG